MQVLHAFTGTSYESFAVVLDSLHHFQQLCFQFRDDILP
jgi:hypothetical protein